MIACSSQFFLTRRPFGPLLSLLLALCAAKSLAYSTGPDPGYAGAPGEGTCVTCHNSFALNSGSGSVAIGGLPASYAPGQTYQLLVTIAQQGTKLWGFQLSDRLTGTQRRGGTLALADSGSTQFGADPDPPGLQYVEHTLAGTRTGDSSGSATFSISWTAPAAGSGSVSFYAVGNAANGDGTNQGDHIYSVAEEAPEGDGISVKVSPSSKDIYTGDSLDLTASVTGVANPQVAWELHDSQTGTTSDLGKLTCPTQDKLTCEGLSAHYVAPDAVGQPVTVIIQAISLDDLTKTASAVIRIIPDIAVSLTSPVSTLAPGGTAQLSAKVTGTTNPALIWSVQNAAGGPETTNGDSTLGFISDSGTYAAPTAISGPVSVILRARSQANSSVFGSATITIIDSEPPVVAMTQPQAGAYLRGIVLLAVDATDDASVPSVGWFLDNSTSPIGVAAASPYQIKWDTSGVSDGSHAIKAVATDASGNVSSPIVLNVVTDNSPPILNKSGLPDSSFQRGVVAINPDVKDNIGLASVSYSLGNAAPFAVKISSPYGISWDTTALADSSYSLVETATDLAGNVATASATILIDNKPPTVSLISPATNDPVSRIVTIKGTATDANFADYLLEYGQGASPSTWLPIGGESLTPVTDDALGRWNTLSLASGSYSLRLTATDQAGGVASETHLVYVVKAGDVQEDGRITVADAMLALQIALGIRAGTPRQLVAADVTPAQADGSIGDGKVTAADVVVILRMALGLQSEPG